MIATEDLQDVFDQAAAWCGVQGEAEAAQRPVLMVTRACGSGNGRDALPGFVDTASLPRGADWAYGLIWAQDAPAGMHPESKMTVTDSSGQAWSCESAKAVYDIDESTRMKVVVAWRLALRGKQRMVRRGK